MNTNTKELSTNEMDQVTGGAIRIIMKKDDTRIYRTHYKVLNDQTGDVMITLKSRKEAEAYARLMAQSNKELAPTVDLTGHSMVVGE